MTESTNSMSEEELKHILSELMPDNQKKVFDHIESLQQELEQLKKWQLYMEGRTLSQSGLAIRPIVEAGDSPGVVNTFPGKHIVFLKTGTWWRLMVKSDAYDQFKEGK